MDEVNVLARRAQHQIPVRRLPLDMANLHVSCAVRNCEYFELLVPEEPFRFPMKDAHPVDERGVVHVPSRPGVGVELDWDAVDRACVEHRITHAP